MNIPQFKNKNIFDLVFTHRSFLNETKEKIDSNERLEFLGDSILSYVISTHIYKEYNNLREGELTSLRSVLSNTNTLHEVAKKLELGKLLKLSKGEEESGGRENKTILANTYEAVVGGLYLDQGIDAVRRFINESIIKYVDEISQEQGLKDSKSGLQEYLQNKYRASPVYKITKEEGPDHNKEYTTGVYLNEKLLAEGSGPSKQEAEKKAAEKALVKLKTK